LYFLDKGILVKMAKERSDFDFDKHALDVEWHRQPKLYYKYATMAADTRKEWEEAKNNLKVVEAEVSLDVRKNPSVYGLEKITEGTISATVVIDDRVKEAQAAVIEARHEMDIVDAAVAAMDSRKKALEKEVDLWLANYFSEPKVKSEDAEKFKEKERRVLRRKGRRSNE